MEHDKTGHSDIVLFYFSGAILTSQSTPLAPCTIPGVLKESPVAHTRNALTCHFSIVKWFPPFRPIYLQDSSTGSSVQIKQDISSERNTQVCFFPYKVLCVY